MAKILVVDDEHDVLENFDHELSLAGHTVGTAHDGVEAVLSVLENTWDVILMDIRMPNVDGISALRIIRRLSPKLPVVMFTGQAGKGEMLTSTQLGAYTCLLKPVSLNRILTVIDEIIEKRDATKSV